MYKRKFEFPFSLSGTLNDLLETTKDGLENYFWSPAVNISEDDNGYTLAVLAPGLTKDVFKIGVENDILEISYTAPKEADETKWIRREWASNSFKRRFTVKNDADQDAISAKYDAGVLTISVPKKTNVPGKSTIKVA